MGLEEQIEFREPGVADAISIAELIGRCPPLDVNSHYLTLLLCRDFYQTCVVAEAGSDLVGFLSAYRPPFRNDTIFVWQVAVDNSRRAAGIASRMLNDLLQRPACHGVRYIEANVTPSNAASRRFFAAVADRLGTKCQWSEGFPGDLFPQASGDSHPHEPEELVRIGPFQSNSHSTMDRPENELNEHIRTP